MSTEPESTAPAEITTYASYCPEDDRLRLYVGRVPREEYLSLKAEGWVSTPKQDCDFVAPWTPKREQTALSYSVEIEDEDQSPEDRAADRAERFGGYRDKRLGEALGHADRYEAGPRAHGYQSQARGERAAARHDRIGGRAVSQWDKAEYWQRRTAGVISNALYKSSPAVRMGRIKTLEAELRKIEASHKKAHEEQSAKHAFMLAMVEHTEGKREKMLPFPGWQYSVCYIREADKLAEDAPFTTEQMRRCMISAAFAGEYSGRWQELRKQAQSGEIEATAVAREWLDANGWETPTAPDFANNEWHKHLTFRIAYENQMLEAQGGRAGNLEMEVGGFIGGYQIRKVNKSNTSGRVVSVSVRIDGNRWGNQAEPGEWYMKTITVERLSVGSYRPPTDEDKAALAAQIASEKKAAPEKAPCPLVNPTAEDAERLQALLNEANKGDSWSKANPGPASTVLSLTQAQYSQISGGTYSTAETTEICALGKMPWRSDMWSSKGEAHNRSIGPVLCKVRTARAGGFGARRVIVLTDRPQKPLPASVWQAAPVVSNPVTA